MADKSTEASNHISTTYFLLVVCIVEITFILWKFAFASTRNGGTFLTTFLIVLAISFPPGLGVALHIFRHKPWSFLFSFGLCIGFGFVGGAWAFMIIVGCPLNPYLYVGTIMIIAGCLLYRKRHELRVCVNRKLLSLNMAEFLSPLAVLLFGFIVLSLQWINNLVPTDVDCQSDSFNSLMVLKEGTYPFVSPYLDKTRLMLCSGPLFHTMIAVITKLKGTLLIKEVMAITVISGAFFCMAVYFLAKFIIKHEIILFLAGILTLTRAYISCFNDNLPENMAFYYGAMFMVFLMSCLENKKAVFALFAGFYLSFCALSHPEIFLYNILAFCLFFGTLFISKDKNLKKDFLNIFIIICIILIMVLPYFFRVNSKGIIFSVDRITSGKVHDMLATTIFGCFPYWNGYVMPIMILGGIIVLAAKKNTFNVYILTYFVVIMFLIEIWRVWQIITPEWFEIAEIYPVWGVKRVYTAPFYYPDSFHVTWYGGVIIWPVIISVLVNYLYCQHLKHVHCNLLNKYIIFPMAISIILYVGYEIRKANKYPEYIKKRDYDALQWIKDNTPYENTLIYAPFDNTGKHPIYGTSFWVPIVSERKSILFRNYNLGGSFKFRNIDNPIKEKVSLLQKAAFSISDPESCKIFKDMKITHIFISAFLSPKLCNLYQDSPFAELVHYTLEPQENGSSIGAFVYRVK